MRQISAWRRVIVGILLAVSFSYAHAADVTARIKGTVTDPTGAVVPKATITAKNQATGVVWNTVSLENGDYAFQALPIGTYSITVNAPGFKGFAATGIVLNIDQEYVESVKLSIGSSSDVVAVEADAVQVNTTDMQLNNIVNSSQMVELPLIGRAFTQLEQIEPGIQASSDRFGGYSANGAQSQQSSFLINGADTNDLSLNTVTFSPNLDAIEQFNLITGPLNAEYDRNSGGIVSATIKQGTNRFHGDAFEFYRDTFLNTRNYFQQAVSPYHQHIFGGTVGGPVLRDKLFFFAAYQGIRQRVPQSGGTGINVYSNNELGGNYSDDLNAKGGNLGYAFSKNPIPGTINIPGCSAGETWAACAAALKGVFPTGAFSPIATSLVKKYVPAATSGTNGYTFNPITATTTNQQIYRADWAPNSRNLFYGLFLKQHSSASDTLPFTGATIPGFGDLNITDINQYTFDYTRTLTPTMVNDFALHYTRFNYQAVTPQNIVSPSSLGFNINPQNTAAASVPTLAVSGFFTLGFSTNGPQPRIDQVYQIDDNFTKILGHHTLKMGYDGRKFNVSNPFSANNSGSYSFSNSSSSSPFSTGDPSLDFLLGIPGTYAQGSGAIIQAKAFLNYLYLQDTWKATDSLTLSYGLGYQIDTTLHNQQYGGEAMICFVPGQTSKIFKTAPVGINYPGDPGCTDSGQAYTRFGDFGPRFGFAYTPNLGWLSDGNSKKLSIRGGFGLYYNRSEEETSLNNLSNPPFGLNSSGAIDFGGQPTLANPYVDIDSGTVYKNKFPYNFPAPGAAIDYSIYEPLSISTYATNFRSPYAENFQLSIERELPSHIVAHLAYVGSLGRHNQITYEGNPETAAGQAACLASTTCVAKSASQSYLYPSHTQYGAVDPITGITGFASIGYVSSEGSSSYHSLQISANKAMSHGLQFQASYTYSHALDDSSNYENSGYGGAARGYNQYVKSLNYGDSQYDARNRFVFSPIYAIPFRETGGTFSPMNLLLAGWQISGIATFASGFPYDISYGGSSSNSLYCSSNFQYYACPDVPNQIAPLVRANPRTFVNSTHTAWFAGSSFAPEAVGTFGNVHRNPYHGPGLSNTNIILAKNFALSADGVRRLQLRMETDNVFNQTQFANPNGQVTGFNTTTGLPTGTFGQISGINTTTSARQTQIAAKFYF
jgi:hypothetical protein